MGTDESQHSLPSVSERGIEAPRALAEFHVNLMPTQLPCSLRGGVCKCWWALPPPSNPLSFASAAHRAQRSRGGSQAAALRGGDSACGLPSIVLDQGIDWRSRARKDSHKLCGTNCRLPHARTSEPTAISVTSSLPYPTSLQGSVSGEHFAPRYSQSQSTRHARQAQCAATSVTAHTATKATVPLLKSIMVYDHVVLTDEEKELFSILLETKEYFGLTTTLRAAGGWVRDKLIGRNSDDVDIALDDMLGKDFAEKVNEYLALKGEEVHSVGVIQTNPEQSKHLETARVRVRGTWIDLV